MKLRALFIIVLVLLVVGCTDVETKSSSQQNVVSDSLISINDSITDELSGDTMQLAVISQDTTSNSKNEVVKPDKKSDKRVVRISCEDYDYSTLAEEESPPLVEQWTTKSEESYSEGAVSIPKDYFFWKDVEFRDTTMIYEYAEHEPVYPGGYEGLRQFLSLNLVYPEYEKQADIQGTVYVRFIVERDGTCSNWEVARGVKGGPGLEKEALRVLKKLEPFSPAKMGSTVVRYRMVQPVKFVLK